MQGLIVNAARLCSVFALLKTAFAFLHTGSASLPFRNRGSSEALALKGGNTPSSDLKTHDILIVGAGYLGQLVAKEWQLKYPGSTVYAETRTDAKHSNLKDMGVVPLLRSERENHPFKEWKTVVFCAAPKGNDDYPGELKTAISLWTGDGHFVFTSSGGIFAEEAGGIVTSDSPTAEGPRAAKLVEAESHVLKAGGTVVRLSGLYDVTRGAHNYWLGLEELDSNPDGIINLIHYEDAALLVISAIEKGRGAKIYIGSDGVPITRKEICDAALLNDAYKGKKTPKFLKPSSKNDGKIYDMTRTFSELSWVPRYASFQEYMKSSN
mmetsp:Transcript_4402/g.7064  ORF Transcript_4402/g.7064 Transcript_4402/m.7064 type:complete len:323 (+) Transcript_4402:61-1029(+)